MSLHVAPSRLALAAALLTIGTAAPSPAQTAQRTTTVDLAAIAPDGIRLAGTLHLPAGDGPFPAVILVHGSEAGTRQHRGYQRWADQLVAAGFATLIVDKRGAGESGGVYVEAPPLDRPAADFMAWLGVLREQPMIRRDAIGLLGWSQAGWIAPLTAERDTTVRFIVLISGPGVSPLEQNIFDKTNQVLAAGLTPAQAEQARTAIRATMTYLVHGTGRDEAAAAWKLVAGQSWFTERYNGIPFMERERLLSVDRGREFAAHNGHDPVPVLGALEIPLLALFGADDTIVPVQQSIDAMEAAMRPGLLTHRTFAGGDHGIVVRTTAGARQLHPDVMPTILDWLRQVTTTN